MPIARQCVVRHLEPAAQRGAVGLFIANPGHEVLLHDWLQRNRPTVFVLGDGSGQYGFPRLRSATRILEQSRARRGSVYGRFSSSEVYRAILDRDLAKLAAVVDELTAWLTHHPVRYLVVDAAEGLDPAQDLCRTMAGVAVELTRAGAGRAVPLYEHVVKGDRRSCVAGTCRDSTRWRLGDEALRRKVTAAHHYRELAIEVDEALERDGGEPYRVECLHHVPPRSVWTCPPGDVPRDGRDPAYPGAARAGHLGALQSALWSLAPVPDLGVAAEA